MSCRLPLRLLRRLTSSSQFPSPPLLLPTRKFSPTSRNSLSTLLPSPTLHSNSELPLPLPHLNKKPKKAESFCTRAAEIDEASTSLFSPYLSVRVRCRKRDADTLSEALLCFGATSVSMDDLSDSRDLDEICITSIFADGQDVATCVSKAANSIGLNYIPDYEVSVGKQCDWLANVQETFHPTEVVGGLWIVPKWRNPPDLQATNIILNPGLAFGTGEHPTTKLCLLLLHGIIKGGEYFLDYGTGSGVLAIAAVKMGAALSVGIDIDPQAVTSARENVSLNGIDSSKMPIYLVSSKDCSTSDASTQEKLENQILHNPELDSAKRKFDIVIANILLNPLMELAEDIIAYGKPDAIVGLSGILSEQVVQIKEIYSQYLHSITVSEMEGWACLCGTKKRN
ncbi:uncharacterized protein [Typha angustifolia]|uniref:uncharacterized protein n=1 Tax=Typha angustifolia TaxID=59011 RepID=UPI003C2E241D